MKYIALKPLRTKEGRVEVGSEIELADEAAQTLLGVGAIKRDYTPTGIEAEPIKQTAATEAESAPSAPAWN